MSDTPRYFAMLNALVDHGHLATMPDLAVRVLFSFFRHADTFGKAFPGPKLLAKELQRDERNIKRAISWLISNGYLSAGEKGAGRGHRAERQIMVPENVAPATTFSNRRKRGAGRTENVAPGATRRTQEGTNEHPTTTTQAGSGGGGGVIAEFFSENPNAARKYSALANERWTPDEQRALVDYLTDGREITHPKRFLKGLLDDPTSVIDWEPIEQWEASIAREEKVREAAQATKREDQEREAARVAVKKINPAELRAWLVVLARVDERFGQLWIDRYPGDCVLDNATHYRNQRHLISIQRNSPRAIIAAIAAATPDQRAEVEALARKFDAECRPARAEVTA